MKAILRDDNCEWELEIGWVEIIDIPKVKEALEFVRFYDGEELEGAYLIEVQIVPPLKQIEFVVITNGSV